MAADTDQALGAPAVLLTGASGQIGVFAIPRLLQAGFRVLAVSRRGRPPGWPEAPSVQWLDEAGARRAAVPCRYLLSAGPLALARDFLPSCPALEAVVAFSSSSVVSKQQSADPLERSQMRDLLRLEAELRQAAQSRGARLVILRPTLVYGCGLDANISRLAAWIRRFGFVPVNGRAGGLRQPAHADDLALAAVTALLTTRALPATLDLPGGSTLSYAEMVEKIFRALGKPVRLLRLPQWLLLALLGLAKLFKAGGGINAEMIRRQRLDLVFDPQAARDFLDYRPRPFDPLAQDFSLPAPPAEIR